MVKKSFYIFKKIKKLSKNLFIFSEKSKNCQKIVIKGHKIEKVFKKVVKTVKKSFYFFKKVKKMSKNCQKSLLCCQNSQKMVKKFFYFVKKIVKKWS